MKVEASRVAELRGEYFADDLVLPSGYEDWDEARLEAFFETGGEPSVPLVPPPLGRPARLLCLHGGGANAKVMAHQIQHLRRLLGDDATFDFVDGWAPPIPAALIRECSLRHSRNFRRI